MADSIWPRLVPCILVLLLTACGTVEEQSTPQHQKAGANREADRLLQKQDAFMERAADLILEIKRLQSHPNWSDLIQTIRTARAQAISVGDLKPEARRAVTLTALSCQAELTGEEIYAEGRRLLERSASLERERQALLQEWTAAGAEARRTISAGQYNARQLRAVLGNTDLFYEMNKSVLSRYRLNELGFLSMALPSPLSGSVPSDQAEGGQP